MSAAAEIRRRKWVKGTVELLILIPIVLVAWSAIRNAYFDPETGAAARYYALTPEGYRFYDAPGADPAYGIPLKPLTKEVITAVRARQEAQFHEYESLDETPYLFHPASGKPQVWYGGDPNGEIQFFSSPGYHPRTGQPLQPITTEVVKAHQQMRRVAEERMALARAERAERRARAAEADLWAAQVALASGQRKLKGARARGKQVPKYALSRIGLDTAIISSVHSSDGQRILYGGKLENGAQFYADRSYTIAGVPSEYVGLPYVRLAYNSKRSPKKTKITIGVGQPVWVHIAWDKRVPLPPWLVHQYENTRRSLYLAERNWAYQIYRSINPVTSGRIITYGQTPSDNSFYLIFVRPR